MKNKKFETKCVHGAYKAGSGEPQNLPIIQSTTFKYDTSEDMGKLFVSYASVESPAAGGICPVFAMNSVLKVDAVMYRQE